MNLKICNKCKEIKELNTFYKSKTGKNGLDSQCKECINKLYKEYRIKNITKRKIYSEEYYSRPEVQERLSIYNNDPINKERKNEYRKKWYKNNIDKQKEFQLISETQNDCCAICGIHKGNLKKDLHVDHDHKTDKIRGLLCTKHNLGIGQFDDNPNLLLKAADYLTNKKSITRADNNFELLSILRDLVNKYEDLRFGQLLQSFGFIKPERAVKDPGRINWQNEFYLEPSELLERVKKRIKDMENSDK